MTTTPNRFRRRCAALATAALALLAAGCATPPPPSTPLAVRILAINDLHGNLKPPPGGITNPARRTPLAAGGAAHMATLLGELRAGAPNHVFVAAGDLVGATPLLSALVHDEPTIEALSLMGLEVAAIGNHELDRGAVELLRLQQGGCHPKDGCKGSNPYRGAGFQYLAANTVTAATGRPLLPPYWIKRFEGVPVAFVGLTTKATPSLVMPSGVAGLEFRDEAATVNALVPDLKRQGVEAIVVLIHEGGVPTGDYDECPGIAGPIVDIVNKLDKAVDVVVSGHTHRAYNCRIDGRLVTSADRYGTIVTQIDLVLDRASRDVVGATAQNHPVLRERYAPHAGVAALIAKYEQIVAPLAQRVVGRVAAPLLSRPNAAGEMPAGAVIADAQLDATRAAGATFALMNAGGVRNQIGVEGRLEVRYEDLFAAQPFYNNLVTMTLSGAQLLQVLEKQWTGGRGILQVSSNVAYTWDAARPEGARVVPGSVTIDGRALDPNAAYRFTVNSFLADGGDNYTTLREGRDRVVGMLDIDALEAWFRSRGVVAHDGRPRITRLN